MHSLVHLTRTTAPSRARGDGRRNRKQDGSAGELRPVPLDRHRQPRAGRQRRSGRRLQRSCGTAAAGCSHRPSPGPGTKQCQTDPAGLTARADWITALRPRLQAAAAREHRPSSIAAASGQIQQRGSPERGRFTPRRSSPRSKPIAGFRNHEPAALRRPLQRGRDIAGSRHREPRIASALETRATVRQVSPPCRGTHLLVATSAASDGIAADERHERFGGRAEQVRDTGCREARPASEARVRDSALRLGSLLNWQAE